MNKSKFFRALICFWTIVLTWSGSFADTEIRTLQSWNLPHPYQGPKSLTENVFAFLVNPAVRDFAQKQGMEINYSKEDDCLLVSGNDKALNVVGGTLSQLRGYGHPYGDLLAPEDVKIGATSAFKFKKICSVEAGKICFGLKWNICLLFLKLGKSRCAMECEAVLTRRSAILSFR